MEHGIDAPAPRTLLDLAGAPPPPLEWDGAVLVLIDFQQEYVDGGLPLGVAGEAAIAAASRLLDAARRHGAPVFHVVHHGAPGAALFDPQGDRVGVVGGLAPAPGEAVVVKGLPNAFAGTALAARVRESGRQRLVIAGFMSHMCVSATARAALDLGFRSIICHDACATRDLPGPTGVVPAAVLHAAEMAALGDRFATIRAVADLPGGDR